MRRSGLRVALVAVFLACVAPGAQAASPAELLGSILSAGRAQHSVHYVSVAHLGALRIVQIADVGETSGIQRITYRNGTRTGHVTVLVSSNRAYFRGDAFTLATYMGLHAGAAATYSNRWILVPPSDRLYSTVAEDVTLGSTISTLRQPGTPTAVPSTTIQGRRVVGVRWRATLEGKPLVTTLYARAAGSHLPAVERTVRGSDSASVSFSRWNEAVRGQVPSAAVPISRTGLE